VTPVVGYYVHHHGRGHLSRAQAIVRHMSAEVTILTSLDARVEGMKLVTIRSYAPLMQRSCRYQRVASLHREPVATRAVLLLSWSGHLRRSSRQPECCFWRATLRCARGEGFMSDLVFLIYSSVASMEPKPSDVQIG
jgi:hypothetical protein